MAQLLAFTAVDAPISDGCRVLHITTSVPSPSSSPIPPHTPSLPRLSFLGWLLQEDERLLRRLLSKVRKSAEQVSE